MALDEFSIPSCVKDAIKEAGYTANTSMEGFISTWWQWYTGTTQWYDEGYTTVEGRIEQVEVVQVGGNGAAPLQLGRDPGVADGELLHLLL